MTDDAPAREGMRWIPGGEFLMGSEEFYPEERPVHRVAVDGFWMDEHPVTVAQFRAFVEATGHVTVAEVAPDPADYPPAPGSEAHLKSVLVSLDSDGESGGRGRGPAPKPLQKAPGRRTGRRS